MRSRPALRRATVGQRGRMVRTGTRRCGRSLARVQDRPQASYLGFEDCAASVLVHSDFYRQTGWIIRDQQLVTIDRSVIKPGEFAIRFATVEHANIFRLSLTPERVAC